MNDSKTSIADLKLGNYTGIRIASIAFLITLLAVVIVSIYLSRSISYDSQAIDIAGRQRMLSQNMSKNIEILSKNEKKYFSKSIQDLKVAYKTFDDTLNGFANGGDTLNTQGGTATLQVVTSPAVREHITQAQAIWAGWKIDIEKVILTSESPDEFSVLIGALEEKVRSQNLELLKLMNSLTVSLKLEARNKSLLQTYISLAALIATIIYFFFIVILSLSNLKRRDQKLLEFSKSIQKNNLDLEQSNLSLITTQNSLEETLETLELSKNDAVSKAQKLEVLTTDLSRLQDESDKIFSTVDHGLCLLKPDFKIGERVSEATYEIFEKKDLTGISFINLMRPLISDKDLSTLTNFLKLQFQGKTLASQLDKFNPLKSVELTLNWDGNTFKNKHVGFEFERIMSGDKVEQVLVTITDITQRVVLERSLEQAEREQAMKSQIIGELMTVDQTEFSRTIVQSERSINEINESLRDKEISGESEIPSELRVKIVNDIFARIHTIKGNASMAGLNQLGERAHLVEEELSTLKNKSSLTGESLLGALVSLSSLRELIDGYRDIKDGFMGKFDPVTVKKAEVSSEESIVKQLSDFGNKIGKEEGKKIQIISNLDFSVLEKKRISTPS